MARRVLYGRGMDAPFLSALGAWLLAGLAAGWLVGFYRSRPPR